MSASASVISLGGNTKTKKVKKKNRPSFRPTKSSNGKNNNKVASADKKTTGAAASAAAAALSDTAKKPVKNKKVVTIGASVVVNEHENIDHDDYDSSTKDEQKQRMDDKGVTTEANNNTTADVQPPPASQLTTYDPKTVFDNITIPQDPEGKELSKFCTRFRAKRPLESITAGANKRNKQNKDDNQDSSLKQEDGEEQQSQEGPTVQIINGEIVLQESSMLMPTRKSIQQVEEELQNQGGIVEEDDQLHIVKASYNSFKRNPSKAPQHWSVSETQLFYKALRQLGTDFCSMEAFFTNRNRRQLKRKYKTECSKNPILIDQVLNPKNQTEIDLSVFQLDKESFKDLGTGSTAAPRDDNKDVKVSEEDTKPRGDIALRSDQQQEVVYEDADDSPAIITQSQEEEEEKPVPEEPLWPEDDDNNHDNFDGMESGNDVAMDDFFAEPSMDDFFAGDNDNGNATANGDVSTTSSPTTTTKTTTTPVPAATEPESLSISLVPTKSKNKKKKPKFKTSARKKK